MSPSLQRHLSAVSQMVSKIIATRADYEVTRQAVTRRNPADDNDWDYKVESLRFESSMYLQWLVVSNCELLGERVPSL